MIAPDVGRKPETPKPSVLFAVWSRVEAVEGTLWYRVVSVNLRRKRDLCGRVLSEGAYHQVLSTLTDNHTNQNSLMLFRMLGGKQTASW